MYRIYIVNKLCDVRNAYTAQIAYNVIKVNIVLSGCIGCTAHVVYNVNIVRSVLIVFIVYSVHIVYNVGIVYTVCTIQALQTV